MLDSSVQIRQGLTLSWQLPPVNDNWRDASPVAGLPLTISGNSLGATVENFETSKPHQSYLPLGSLWWKWTPGVAGVASVTATANHFVFVLPLESGKPSFPEFYEYFALIQRQYPVEADKSYAILAIPQTPAAAGPFTVAFTGIEDIAMLSHPVDVATLLGEVVELGVQVASSSYPTYQWYKNGLNIPFANHPTLKLSPVTEQSYGSYHVTVTSATTTLQSHPAVVSPRFEKPRLIGQTPRRSVAVGQSVALGASFRSASTMTYAWRKNGQTIPNATAFSFSISSAAVTDSGTYSLIATNPAGSTTASFQVDVVTTPWKGWVNRTPNQCDTGAILDVTLNGNAANAFTSTEWLRSSDGGQSWITTPLPPNYVASSGASDSNGSALIAGGVFSSYSSYPAPEIWSYKSSTGWQKIQPRLNLANGSSVTVTRLTGLTFFDGEWWALFYSDYTDKAVHSADGINWTALDDPENPSNLMRASEMFRYEDRLAISYWKPNGRQTVMLRLQGGWNKILDFSGFDVRSIARLDGASYSSQYTKLMKIADIQISPSLSPLIGLESATHFVEGKRDGAVFFALEDPGTSIGAVTGGRLWLGVHEKTASPKNVGFSCFAKSGDRWLVGYPNGRLWSGSDLTTLPEISWGDLNYHPGVTAYENEFVFGKYHSSDGVHWQLLGAANKIGKVVLPLGQAGSNFLHSIREGSTSLPTRKFMSPAFYPSALGPTDSDGILASGLFGDDSLLNRSSLTVGTTLQMIRNQPPGILIENVNLGILWSSITFSTRINGRWFVSGIKTDGSSFVVTSIDGRTWQSSGLPAGCMVGSKGAVFIAIENSARGYSSSTGLSWTPFTPQGLPVLNQINLPATPTSIVSYRNYYVAQYAQSLYSSADGISWALSSAPLPVSYLASNRQTLLAVSTTGEVLQPGGDTASGPSITLSESQQAISVPLHQGFKYELIADDADGDLASVECLVDGTLVSSLTAAPFVFPVNPGGSGDHAVEFVARDQVGRISRVTSTLTILQGGVTHATALVIDFDLSKAVLFKGDYYRIYSNQLVGQAAVCVWKAGDRWMPVSQADFAPISLVANAEALVASTSNGILTSSDGLNWTHFGGFNTTNQTAVILGTRDGLIQLQDLSGNWVSRDGISWVPARSAAPPYSTSSTANIAWADADFGLSNPLSYGNCVTYDGGRTWLPLSGTVSGYYSTNMPVTSGFLVRNSDGIFRLLRGEVGFTQIYQGSDYYAAKIDNRAFVGKAGTFLKSTTDGITFTDHTPPPNETLVFLRRFSGEWIAASSEMICASKDLHVWRVLFDFRTLGFSTQDLATGFFNISQYGMDSLLYKHPRLPTNGFVLNPDFSVTQISLAESTGKVTNDGALGGLRFKNRFVALSRWYFTRSVNNEDWEQAPLYPSTGFVPPYPHAWPVTFSDRYNPTASSPAPSLCAATDQRLIVFRLDRFNVPLNYVMSSDDGRSFTVSNWTGPIPLPEVTGLVASPTSFLASATNGRVLRSPDGLQWTVHQVSPALTIRSLLYFNGKWRVAGTQGNQAEVWTSTDGVAWTRSAAVARSGTYSIETSRPAFVAKGIARMYAGDFGWLQSGDGTNWRVDTVLQQSMKTFAFEPQGEHPLGIIGRGYYGFVIVDSLTGSLVRSISSDAASLRWIDGWPFLSSPGRFVEWMDDDPRLTGITADTGVFGVGDYVTVRLSATELADPTIPVQFLLTTDQKLGNVDDVVLASTPWNKGALLSSGERRYQVPLPPSVTPGKFRVAARLIIPVGTKDIGLQNNQIVTGTNSIEIPGYELRLTTNGLGIIKAIDPRVLYPQGARLQLQAVPESGFTFRSWTGSMVSSESAISILMESDKQLAVTFTPGHRVVVKTVGNGTIRGAQNLSMLLPNESVHLTQTPVSGWTFDRWIVDGLAQPGGSLSLQPLADTVIEGVFTPDFTALRNQAFINAPPGTDRGWNADSDGDGLTNWQEVLLSTNPLVAQSLAQRVERRSDALRFVFSRPQGPTATPWIMPEFSESLSTWAASDSLRMTERILGVENGTETIEVTLPIQSGSHGFFHLRMEGAPASP